MKHSRLNAFSLIVFIAITLNPIKVLATTCLAPKIDPISSLLAKNESWAIEAGELTGAIGEEIEIRDKIKIVSGPNNIIAEEVLYNEDVGRIRINKGLILENNNLLVFAESAVIETDNNNAVITSTDYQLLSPQARGTAEEIRVESENEFTLIKPFYTSCANNDDTWGITAEAIQIKSDEGIAKNLVLKVKNTPIFFLPYLSFPASEKRKSGILVPNFGSSSKKGTEIEMPYYWNIAPNMDMVSSINWMGKRGIQLTNNFRFLTSRQTGEISFDILPNDDITGRTRNYIGIDQSINLASNWRVRIDGEYASDNEYFEDLTGSINSTSRTHLFRSIHMQGFSENWLLDIGMDNFQILDQSISLDDKPHRILPYVDFNGQWVNKKSNLSYGLDLNLAHFDSSVNITGTRFHAMPNLSKTFNFNGLQVKPEIELDLTSYNLEGSADDALKEDRPNRTVPIYSLDIQALFKKNWEDHGYIQTLEPRILGVYIPFKNQDDFPVFDSIVPDRNIYELFRKNRYLGQDRIGDTSKLSYGITSRIYGKENSSEFFNFTFGKTRYFKDRKINLPGELPNNHDSSAYLATMQWSINPRWRLKLGHVWDSDYKQTNKTQIGIRYKSANSKIMNLSYRYRKENLKQLDASFSWPIRDKWNFVGKYNYSIEDRKSLEHFFGIEYESCCWGIRAISRKHLIYRNGETDTSFSIQFVFKGLGEVGMPIENLLEEGILGYDVP